jgi:hypothetical protein
VGGGGGGGGGGDQHGAATEHESSNLGRVGPCGLRWRLRCGGAAMERGYPSPLDGNGNSRQGGRAPGAQNPNSLADVVGLPSHCRGVRA